MALDVNRVVAAAIDAAFEHEQDRHRHRRLSGVTAFAAGAAVAMVARAATQKKVPRIAKFGAKKLVDVPNLRDVSDAVRGRLADYGLLGEDQDDQYEPDDQWDEPDDDEDYGDDEPDDHEDEPPEDEAEEDWDEQQEGSGDDERDDEPQDEADDEPQDEEDDDQPPDDDEPSDDGDSEAEAGTEEDGDDEGDEDDQKSEAPSIELASENGAAAERAVRGLDVALQSGRTLGAAPDLMQLLESPHSPPPASRRARKQDPLKRPPEPAPRSGQADERSKRTRGARPSNSKSKSKTKTASGRKRSARRN